MIKKKFTKKYFYSKWFYSFIVTNKLGIYLRRISEAYQNIV